jgi:hypothetical protein
VRLEFVEIEDHAPQLDGVSRQPAGGLPALLESSSWPQNVHTRLTRSQADPTSSGAPAAWIGNMVG